MGTATQTLRTSIPRGRSPRIREARFEDYPQIAALHRRNGLSMKSFEQWAGLWTANPAYNADDVPLGWVLETERGDIAGSIGNLPLEYEFQGRLLNAATAYGWVVDESLRGYSVALLSRFLRQPGVELYVFTSVGEKAEPVYSAFQISRVPRGCWNRSYLWITNYRGFARSLIHRKNLPLNGVLTPCAAAGFALWDAARGGFRPRPDTKYQIEICAGFDGRFDNFWHRLRQNRERQLIAVRSRRALEWHFRNPATILAVTTDSSLVAYAIFNRQDNSALQFERVRLVDFQALEGHRAAIEPALRWMLDDCRRSGVDALEVMGSWLDQTGLPPRAIPYSRLLSSWSFYYKAVDPALAAALRDPAAWAPTSYDGDASL